MIHTHNDNSVNFLSPGSGGMEGGEDFGGSLSCQGNVGEGGGGQSSPTVSFAGGT